jgi:PAS domain S-box-containing protein
MLTFLNGTSDMAQRVRAFDWAATPLGPPAGWPEALKTLVGVMLDANQPMFVAWGDSRTMIYNDPYAEILAAKHPAALGQPFLDIWSEIRADLAPIVDRAFAGEPVHMDDIELLMERNGYPEETHFTFSYTPIRTTGGGVEGFFCPCTEITQQVLAARAVRDSEARAHQIFDSVTDYAIIVSDLDRRVTGWNEGARRLLGWTEEEMLGQLADRIFTPEDLAADRPVIEARCALDHGMAPDERWHMRHDGSRFWANGEMTPLRDDAGRVIGLVKILRDRTAQRAAEQALEDSEARFRQAAEAIPGFLWIAQAHGAIDYISPSWQAYAGADTDAGRVGGWAEFVHPDDHEQAIARWTHSARTGDPFEIEFRLRRADGLYCWWLARAVAVRDEAGAITRWIGVGSDIEEIVAARETLARSREDLEQRIAERTRDLDRMWRLSTDVMLVADFDAQVQSVNPAWTTQLGWAQSDLIGTDFMRLVHPDDVAPTLAEVGKLAQGITTLRFENRYQCKNGTYRWLSWTAVPDEHFIHAVGRDIQAEKDAAEALRASEDALRQAQKMEAVGQLTGGIAHDFNNLLTGVIGGLDLMQRKIAEGRTGELDRYVSMATTSANRAAALTHRLLAFSRRQPLDPRPVNANRLVTSMEELLRRTIGEGIELEIVTAGGLWQTQCDPHQLESALLNLAINARDAMPEGGKLTVETCNAHLDSAYAAQSREVRPGQYVCICVSDTGTGMSKEVIEKAFEPFFTTKPIGQGTGLGLSMIYGFARQSDGYAKIYSEVGKGTTFKIYLPRHYGEGEEQPDDAPESRVLHMGQGEMVLVVEDQSAIRALVVEVLTDLGYHTLEAADGPSGLKILETGQRIDLLVTDVGLPGLNGRQLADAARARRPELKVLFMTGYAENAAINGGFLDPGMELITKPFAIEALVQKLETMLDRSGEAQG